VCYHADYEQFHEYEKRNHLLLLSGDDCGETGAVSAPGELRAALKGYARAARQTAPDFCEIRNRQLTKGCTRGRVWPFFFCCHTKGKKGSRRGDGGNAPYEGDEGFRPTGAGREPTPHFLSRKENAPLTVEKKQRRVPAKALAGIPAPGVTTGVGLGAALRYVGTIRERFSGIARGAHRLPLLSFCCRRAVRSRDFPRGVHAMPLRPPDCGSKMKAGTIGDGFERAQFYNSRGRGNQFTPGLPRAAASLLHL
jgi:hypothetical protein